MSFLKNLNKNFDKFFPFVLVVFCFFLTITRIPFFDEANAYFISSYSIKDIFEITRTEGHPALWFLLLKIISANANFYPYSILILNWAISAFLIFFFWRKAPFGLSIKTLIMLSYPFLNHYFIVARPYCLSILSLFFLAYFYNQSDKKLILYSILLFFSFNITLMSAIGAFAFFVLFVKKIIKHNLFNKKTLLSLLIVFIGIVLLYLQLANPQMPIRHYEIEELVKNHLIY